MRKISDYVLRNSTNSKKGMGDLMGGKVLELETDWFDDAVREARKDERNLLVLAMLSNGVSVEKVSKMCNLPLEEVRRIEKS